eukprot:gnl/TRDRNA2_/TRDRNA2_73138_c1_seq1.p1 gnl/TRDRNA2_/TRDRNA2_73138_c1~~gnl/TRDRNA2_/TRDRNA2_73138_c1_seq1.p1  ORF type:complete len:361 (+),score=51.86 gnl/TRDRNA2_/TRDRNA2_73138_c1_seq1:152-1084(+)
MSKASDMQVMLCEMGKLTVITQNMNSKLLKLEEQFSSGLPAQKRNRGSMTGPKGGERQSMPVGPPLAVVDETAPANEVAKEHGLDRAQSKLLAEEVAEDMEDELQAALTKSMRELEESMGSKTASSMQHWHDSLAARMHTIEEKVSSVLKSMRSAEAVKQAEQDEADKRNIENLISAIQNHDATPTKYQSGALGEPSPPIISNGVSEAAVVETQEQPASGEYREIDPSSADGTLLRPLGSNRGPRSPHARTASRNFTPRPPMPTMEPAPAPPAEEMSAIPEVGLSIEAKANAQMVRSVPSNDEEAAPRWV